jgi:hypothetical protein
MRLATRHAAALAAAVLLLAACGGSDDDGDGAPQGQQNVGKDDLVAQVASFDLAVGPPTRLIVGLLTGDQRFVVYGTVQFRLAYLGTQESNRQGTFGSPVVARFLPIPGTMLPASPQEPQAVSPSEARGVYAAEVAFDKAGYWQVEVAARMGGTERRATAALAVNEKHAVPAPGQAALPTENLTLASTDAPMASTTKDSSHRGTPGIQPRLATIQNPKIARWM